MPNDATWWIPGKKERLSSTGLYRVIGDLKNGRSYREQYHMLVGFKDGNINCVRKYPDSQHENDVWVSPLGEPQLAGTTR